MATSIDTGYTDFEAEKWCKLLYFPSPMMPERNVSKKVLLWMYMGSYESSIDAQTLDAKRLEIERCAYLNCGYTFIDIHSHYWQFHSNYIRPNNVKANCTKDTVTKSHESSVNLIGSNIRKDIESVDKAKPDTVTKLQESSVNLMGSNKKNDIESVFKAKPEMRREVLSIQPAKNNSHNAPGIETGEELATALKYNTEVSSNEDIEATKGEDK